MPSNKTKISTRPLPRLRRRSKLAGNSGTPISKQKGFVLPEIEGVLHEMRTFIDLARPTDSIFRTNHASNWMALAGRLPRDRQRFLDELDAGEIPQRPSWSRGL